MLWALRVLTRSTARPSVRISVLCNIGLSFRVLIRICIFTTKRFVLLVSAGQIFRYTVGLTVRIVRINIAS